MIALFRVANTLFIFSASLLTPTTATTRQTNYKWTEDTLENCKQLAEDGKCIQDDITYFQCPISCSNQYRETQTIGKSLYMSNSDDFYDLTVRSSHGKEIDLSRYEGYVTVLAVVPLLKGLAQFSFEMLEHIHSVYPYTLEIMILPVKMPEDMNESSSSVSGTPLDEEQQLQLLQPVESKMTILETITTDDLKTYKVIKLLEKNTKQNAVYTDRVVCYVISADADKADKQVSENMMGLELIASHYIKRSLGKDEL